MHTLATALTNMLEHSWKLRLDKTDIWSPRFIDLHVYVIVCEYVRQKINY